MRMITALVTVIAAALFAALVGREASIVFQAAVHSLTLRIGS
jgi:hypothetical protein